MGVAERRRLPPRPHPPGPPRGGGGRPGTPPRRAPPPPPTPPAPCHPAWRCTRPSTFTTCAPPSSPTTRRSSRSSHAPRRDHHPRPRPDRRGRGPVLRPAPAAELDRRLRDHAPGRGSLAHGGGQA